MKKLFISMLLSLAISVTAMAAEGGTQEPAQEAGYAQQYDEDAPIDDEPEYTQGDEEEIPDAEEGGDIETEEPIVEEGPEAGDIEEEMPKEEEEAEPDAEEDGAEETESEEELEELARLDASALRSTFRKVGARTYYYNEKGIRVTGWNKIGGKTYYMGPTGAIQTGWKTLSGKKYYFWPDVKRYGWMATGWPVINGSHYYMGSDGVMRIGWQAANGFKYYMGTNGVIQTGLKRISGKTYYFYPRTEGKHYRGTAARGFATVSGKSYYFGKDCTMATGWQTINGFRYYFGTNGIMRTGWQAIDGKKYYFFGSTIKKYKRHFKGTAATYLNNVDGSWYYMDPKTGACQSGWKDFEGLKYYFWPSTCKAATGTVTISGNKYSFSANGVLQNPDYFKITMVDLGGGSAVWGDQTLLESNGKYLLIDTGIKDTRTVITYLKSHKIRNFDLLISHYHKDHVGNYGRILKDGYFHVGPVYLPSSGGGFDSTARKYAKKCVIMKAGTEVNFGSVKGKVLYRSGSAWVNNGSAAVMFSGGGIKYLTCGDIESGSEKNLMKKASVKADVFKFNHHGDAAAANKTGFINAVDADIYLSNCCGDSPRTMNTWARNSYSKAKNAGGMVLSSRYNGSFTVTARNGHMSVYLPRHGTTKTVTAFNARTGSYEKVKIAVNANNSKINSKKMLPAGYRLKK